MFEVRPEQLSLEVSTTLMHVQAVTLSVVVGHLLLSSLRLTNQVATVGGRFSARFWFPIGGIVAGFFLWIFFSEWGMDYPLLALSYAIGLILSFFHPINALCLFVASQFLRPWEVMASNDLVLALPRILGLAALTSWCLHDLMKGGFKTIWNSTTVILIVFSVWIFITTFKSPDPTYSQTTFSEGFTRNLMIYFLVLNMIRSSWELDAVIMTLLYSVIGVSAMACLYAYSLPEVSLDGGRLQSVSMMGNSNDLAAIVIMALPILSFGFLNQSSKIKPYLALPTFAVGGFFLWIIWWAKSRGSLIALMLIVAMHFLGRIKSRAKAFALVILMVIVLLGSFSLLKRSADDVGESTSSRLLYWKTAVYMALKNPLFGVGYTGYPANFEQYAPETPIEWGARTAHSSWFLVLGETGFLGLMLYVGLFVQTLRAAWKVRKFKPELFPMLAGYMAAMTFLSHTFLIYPYFILGFVLAAERVYRERTLSETG